MVNFLHAEVNMKMLKHVQWCNISECECVDYCTLRWNEHLLSLWFETLKINIYQVLDTMRYHDMIAENKYKNNTDV